MGLRGLHRGRLLAARGGLAGLSLAARADLALDALEMAIWARRGEDLGALIHHSDRGVPGNTRPRPTPRSWRAMGSAPASAGPPTAGTTRWRRASSRRSSSTSSTATGGRPGRRRGAPSSSTSRSSTPGSAAIRRSATSVRQTTNPATPLCARPNKSVRQSGSGPGPARSRVGVHAQMQAGTYTDKR